MSDEMSSMSDLLGTSKLTEEIEAPHRLAEEMSRPVRELEAATGHLRDLGGLAGPLRDMEAMSAPVRRMEEEMKAMTSPAMLKVERAMAEEAERSRKMIETFRNPLSGADTFLGDLERRREQIADITRRAAESSRPLEPAALAPSYADRMNDMLAEVDEGVREREEREEKWRSDSLDAQRAIGEGIGAVSAGLSDLREATGELVATAVAQRKVAEAQAEALGELTVTAGAQAAELQRLRKVTEEAGGFWRSMRVPTLSAVAGGLVVAWFTLGMPTWGLGGAIVSGWAWLWDLFG